MHSNENHKYSVDLRVSTGLESEIVKSIKCRVHDQQKLSERYPITKYQLISLIKRLHSTIFMGCAKNSTYKTAILTDVMRCLQN